VQVIPPETYSDEEFEDVGEGGEGGDGEEAAENASPKKKKEPPPPTRSEVEGVEIEDLGNGQHVVRWVPPAANIYEIEISYEGTFGGQAAPLGQGPWEVTVEEPGEKVAEDSGRLNSDSFLNKARTMLKTTVESINQIDKDLAADVVIGDTQGLLRAKETIAIIDNGQEEKEREFETARQLIDYLGTYQVRFVFF